MEAQIESRRYIFFKNVFLKILVELNHSYNFCCEYEFNVCFCNTQNYRFKLLGWIWNRNPFHNLP